MFKVDDLTKFNNVIKTNQRKQSFIRQNLKCFTSNITHLTFDKVKLDSQFTDLQLVCPVDSTGLQNLY